MRTTSALKTAALLIAAVVLALGTVQGSLAVWNTSTTTRAGSIQAADFKVTLASGSGAPQRLSANGVPATVALPAITNLKPGETRTLPVAITNDTDAGNGAFRIRLTASTPVTSPKAPAQLTTTAGLSTAATCTTKTTTSVDLAQGGDVILCITVALAADAPATLGGQTQGVSVKLTAAQL